MWYSFAPTKVRQVSFAINLSIRNSTIAMAADMEEVLIADMQHWHDAMRISFIRTVAFSLPANWLEPCALQFSSALCVLDCVDNLTHTLSLREAGTCATRS